MPKPLLPAAGKKTKHFRPSTPTFPASTTETQCNMMGGGFGVDSTTKIATLIPELNPRQGSRIAVGASEANCRYFVVV
jgi:hypothetical protein